MITFQQSVQKQHGNRSTFFTAGTDEKEEEEE